MSENGPVDSSTTATIGGMTIDDDVCYRALIARDARFDGVFFVGVKTTGIYCRPVCTAKTPGRSRCRFFASAALAEQAGFRPCLRCRPELAPGHAPVDSVRTIARAAAARIEAGALSSGGSLEDLAASLGLSSRHLRRSMRKELGVSPLELAQTSRLLLAKRLIAETRLPMVQVAFAAGFESVRRFNALFHRHYRLTPSLLRRTLSKPDATDCLRLFLAYRPPFGWTSLLQFLAARAIPGVECVTNGAYHRTVEIGEHRGWLSVSSVADRNMLAVDLAIALAPALPSILVRLRNLLDLDARPDVIAGQLALDPPLAPWVERQPGLRVPGAFDAFELGWRAIVGAASLGSRSVDACRPHRGAIRRRDRGAAGLLETVLHPAPRRLLRFAARRSPAWDYRERGPRVCTRWPAPSLAAKSISSLESIRPRCWRDLWSFPASGRGLPSTSQCAPCAGRTRFRWATGGS